MKNKKLKLTMLTLLFLSIGLVSMAGNKVLKIKTSAICDMCKHRIELAVNNLDGVKKSLLNLNTQVLKVKYDTKKLNETDIKTAVSNAGYDAGNLDADKKAYSVLPACCKKGSSCDTKNH